MIKGEWIGESKLNLEETKCDLELLDRLDSMLNFMEADDKAELDRYEKSDLKSQFVELFKMAEDPFGDRIKGI